MRHCREGSAHESPLPRATVAVHRALPRGAAHESPPWLARNGRSCKSHESRTHYLCATSAKVRPMTHRLVRNNVLGWRLAPPCHANPLNSGSCCVAKRFPLYHREPQLLSTERSREVRPMSHHHGSRATEVPAIPTSHGPTTYAPLPRRYGP